MSAKYAESTPAEKETRENIQTVLFRDNGDMIVYTEESGKKYLESHLPYWDFSITFDGTQQTPQLLSTTTWHRGWNESNLHDLFYNCC